MTSVIPEASTATPDPRDQRPHAHDSTQLAALIAALPATVDEAMQKAIPHLWTPELAAQIAEGVATELRNPQPAEPSHYPWCQPGECIQEDGGIWSEHAGRTHTAVLDSAIGNGALEISAQLGQDDDFRTDPTVLMQAGVSSVLLDAPALDKAIGNLDALLGQLRVMRQQMAPVEVGQRHNSPLTPAQSTLAFDYGLGGWRTAPVETDLRDIDSDRDPDCVITPFLGAEVVVSDCRSQAYGRTTKVWLHYGSSTGEVTHGKAREVYAATTAFLPKLKAVIDLAEEQAADDFEGDPEIARLDTEAEDRRFRAIREART